MWNILYSIGRIYKSSNHRILLLRQHPSTTILRFRESTMYTTGPLASSTREPRASIIGHARTMSECGGLASVMDPG